MVFSSLFFILRFLPIFLLLYYLVPRGWRNGLTLLASMAFYLWGAPQFFLTILLISWIDYSLSLLINKSPRNSAVRKNWLSLGIFINLSVLFYFKYSNFIFSELNHLASYWGATPLLHWGEVLMPIGISFIVFEEISYLVDVYRGESQPAKHFSTYTLFLFLFPHSIAGPIFRWKDLEFQLIERNHSLNLFLEGLLRFILGLGKKVLIADQMATTADLVFGHSPATLPWNYAWVGMLSYTLQIYFDFSGYSDMAIGIGKMIGFQFKENFNFPYIAESVTDFWKRWHISLSTWMRDYLYIPLGGNKVSLSRNYLNLVIVFLVSGFWHGANWTFLAWGAWHGCWLAVEKFFLSKNILELPKMIKILKTAFIVMLGWVLFRSQTIESAIIFIQRLFAITDIKSYELTTLSWGEVLPNRSFATLVIGIVISVFPALPKPSLAFLKTAQAEVLRYSAAIITFIFVCLKLSTTSYSPFIYFRF